MISHGQYPPHLFHKLKVLELLCFHDESAAFPLGFLQRLHNLETLVVNCSSFKEIFAYEGFVGEDKHAARLACTKNLKLHSLPALKHIWMQPDPVLQSLETLAVRYCHSLINVAPSAASFQNLTSLDVWNCDGLMNLVKSSTARSMVQLIKMSVNKCSMVTEIVAND